MRYWVPVVSLVLALGLSCGQKTPRKTSVNAEHLTPATLPQSPAINAEVYVPVYSSLAYADGRAMVELSAQLAIHNTDSKSPIVLEFVRYYDTSGGLLRDEIEGPRALAPMATTTFLVHKRDLAGGVGANYLVRWRSASPVSEPLLESVMADLTSSYALAFTSRGVTTRSVRGAVLEP